MLKAWKHNANTIRSEKSGRSVHRWSKQIKSFVKGSLNMVKTVVIGKPNRSAKYIQVYPSFTHAKTNMQSFSSKEFGRSDSESTYRGRSRRFSSDTESAKNLIPIGTGWPIWKLLAVGGATVSLMQLVLWIYEERKKDATHVDVGWAFGLGVLSVLYAAKGTGDPKSRLLVGIVGSLWSARLTYYLFTSRVLSHKGEDVRYQDLRKKWDTHASRNFFIFFQFQALFDILFSIPLLVCATRKTTPSNLQALAALTVAAISIFGEKTADQQLHAFREKPENKGKVCKEGLWKYSRHPNYFFEWVYWFTYVVLGVGSKKWPITFVGPAAMLLFLWKITGIPYTEKMSLQSKGEAYREYQRTTNAFFPWFPKNNSE